MSRPKRNVGKNLLLWLFLFVIISNIGIEIVSPTDSQTTELSKSDNINEIAQYDNNYGFFCGVTGEGNILIAATGDRIHFFDITNKSNPVVKQELRIDFVTDLVVENEILYLIDKFDKQFQSYDISDLNNIRLLDSLNFTNYCYNLEIYENKAYIISSEDNITIIDITNPNNLEKLANIEVTRGIRDFCVSENYIYSINHLEYIVVTNITDYQKTETVTSYHNGSELYMDLKIKDSFLFVTEELSHRLIILNITNPETIDYISSCGYCDGYQIIIEENLVFLADFRNLYIINVTNLLSPEIIADEHMLSGSLFLDLYSYDEFLYISEASSFTTIDCTNTSNPIILNEIKSEGSSRSLSLDDGIIYVADYQEGIEIFEFNTTTNVLEKIDVYRETDAYGNNLDYYYQTILFDGEIAYASTGSEIISVLKKEANNSLTKIEEYTDISYEFGYFVMNDRYLFAKPSELMGISIINKINKYSPRAEAFYFDSAHYYTFKVKDERLYGLYSNSMHEGIRILDIENPSSIEILTEYNIDKSLYYSDIEIHDNYLYISVSNEVLIFEIKKESALEKVSEYSFNETYIFSIIACSDDYLVVGIEEGIAILDISDKENPVNVAHYLDGGLAYDGY